MTQEGVDMIAKRALIQTVMLVFCIVSATFVADWQDAGAQQQTGDLMTVSAILHVQLCRAWGGTAFVDSYTTHASGTTNIWVDCHGGLLSGFHCNHTPSGSYCGMRVQPKVDLGVTPVEPLDLGSGAPKDTPVATDMPVTSTTIPTEAPAAPTIVPSTVPVEPTPEPTAAATEESPVPTKVPVDQPEQQPPLPISPDEPAPTEPPVLQ